MKVDESCALRRFYLSMLPTKCTYYIIASITIDHCHFPVLGHNPHLVFVNQYQ